MTMSIPESTLVITLTAVGLAVASNVATRLLVDLKTEKRLKAEVAEFDKDLRDAMAKKDKDREERLKKKKPQIDQMRMKASTGRFKVLIFTWVPFIIVYYAVAGQVGGFGEAVALSPLPIPYIVAANGNMVLIWWYFLSSLSWGTIVSKLLGTAP
jgi:uncharacterized membrane protein (DUF106 family)